VDVYDGEGCDEDPIYGGSIKRYNIDRKEDGINTVRYSEDMMNGSGEDPIREY
jgi:hypothetical protein